MPRRASPDLAPAALDGCPVDCPALRGHLPSAHLMHYLITGGAGFIRSPLAAVLLQRGAVVVALDDVSTGSIDNVEPLLDHPHFTLRQGTVLDRPLVAQLAG